MHAKQLAKSPSISQASSPTVRKLRTMSSRPAGVRGKWRDGETRALIGAWRRLHHLRRNGGSIDDAEEWRRVCSAVNAHRADAGLHINRSLAQCQKKVSALKDQYDMEVAKGQPTPGWRHFGQLHAFLAGPLGPPPSFPAKLPPASVKVKEEEMVEEASGSVGRRMSTVPAAKRHFSGPSRMPAKATAADKEAEEEVGRECPACGVGSPAAVVTKLAEVFERVEMERLIVQKQKMAMEREKRAAKVEAENPGETENN